MFAGFICACNKVGVYHLSFNDVFDCSEAFGFIHKVKFVCKFDVCHLHSYGRRAPKEQDDIKPVVFTVTTLSSERVECFCTQESFALAQPCICYT